MRHFPMLLALMALALQVPPSIAQAYVDITPERAYEMLASDPSVFLLDVRTPGEYQEGHIGGAVLIPSYELASRLNELPANRSAPILVYCLVGGRSASSANVIAAEGYAQIYNMLGGISDWMAGGYPVVTGPDPGVFHADEGFILLLGAVAIAGLGLKAWGEASG